MSRTMYYSLFATNDFGGEPTPPQSLYTSIIASEAKLSAPLCEFASA